MGKKYTVTENPPPYTQGLSTTSSINTELNRPSIYRQPQTGRLVNIPAYNITPKVAIKSPATTVNNTTINQEITIINQGNNSRTSAQYNNTNIINPITTRTQLINNGGLGTYDDNSTPVWSTITNKIICNNIKELLSVTLNLKCSTNTLGGSFEIEANNGAVIDIIETGHQIQNQDFNIEFTIVTDQNCVTNGIGLFITPELGMTININDFSLLIIKG
jgi:hypothetical protein